MSESRLKTKPNKKPTDYDVFRKDVRYNGLKCAMKKAIERYHEKYFWWRFLLFLLVFVFILYTTLQQIIGGN